MSYRSTVFMLPVVWWRVEDHRHHRRVCGDSQDPHASGLACARAKALLESGGYHYDEINLGKHITSSTLRAVSGSGTWPQVFIGGKQIGGADDLQAYFDARKAV